MAKIKNTAVPDKKKKRDKKFKAKHYPCSYCSKTFSERAGRDHHLQLHSSERPFSCSLCPHTCKTKKYLAKHVRVVHKPPTSFKCEYCDKMFHYKCILDKHIVVHTNSRPHKCKECGKGFNSQYSLRTHTLIHKNLKPYKCNYCDYACRDSSTLRKHHERHIGIVTRYKCNICDKQFSNKQLLQYHVAEVHMKLNLKKVPCEQCDRMFRTKKMLSIHIEVKHNRKFATTCEICGLKLANKYNMNSHLMSHVNVRPYKCAFAGCDKRYKDRSSLQKHSIIHYPEKQFPCKICGKKFTRKERLRRHKKQHVAKVKNVQCDYCGVCFYNKNYLSVHILKKHSRRKKKFICDMCDFESGNKPGLIKHIKGHDMRLDKECPMCTKRYKQENWLKLHLWHAHNVIEPNGTPTFPTNVKVEPIDVEGMPEFELFEIEKEEILDELHSITKDRNSKQNIGTETVIDEGDKIQEHGNTSIIIGSEDLNYDNTISRCKESVQEDLSKYDEVQITEYASVTLQNNNIHKSSPQLCRQKDLSGDESLKIYGDLANTDNNLQNKVLLVRNLENKRKSMSVSKCVLIDDNDKLDNSNIVRMEVENCDQHPKDEISENDSAQNEDRHYDKGSSQHDCKQLHNSEMNQSNICNVSNLTEKSQTNIKTRLEDEIRQTGTKISKRFRDLDKETSISKGKSLAHLKAALLEQKQSKNSKINSETLSDSEELDQGLEYSKAVFSEDITRCVTERKKKGLSEKNFDDLFIQHIVERQQKSVKKVLEIDKDSELYAKNCLDRLLEKTKNDNEIKLIEKTRQQYNERIKKANKIRPDKVSIIYFDKTNRNKGIKKTNSQEKNNVNNGSIHKETDINWKTVSNAINYDENNINKNTCEKSYILNDFDNPTQKTDANINYGNDKATKGQSEPSSNKEFDDYTEQSQSSHTVDRNGENETKRVLLRSDSSNKKRVDDEQDSDNGQIRNVDEYRKIKLNTHQCYVCFKLFESKEQLLDHCKDHFEVCNLTILKKCPLCDFATNLNIVQHMKVQHDVEITIPSTRILDKESEHGPRYCYKVNSATITDIDVIPSVKHLNKQAYIAIDKKNRKLKDTGIAKTKLVKKGNEWIVERQSTKIDNVDEFILPKFNVDEILSIKIDSNDYLSRMKKLYRLAKKHKKQMLFPCENCEKICQTLSALKLHSRRHDPKSKPFKKKVWKHKMKDIIQPRNKKITDVDYGKKKYSRVVEIDKYHVPDNTINDNRYKKPKPVVNKHKCDPELIKFYETNIKGADIEFWQFLKIFNKMSRENVNDFNDLNDKPEFGIHFNETKSTQRMEGNAEIVYKRKENLKVNEKEVNSQNKSTSGVKPMVIIANESKYKRIIRISKKEYERRKYLKQKLRDKIAKENAK